MTTTVSGINSHSYIGRGGPSTGKLTLKAPAWQHRDARKAFGYRGWNQLSRHQIHRRLRHHARTPCIPLLGDPERYIEEHGLGLRAIYASHFDIGPPLLGSEIRGIDVRHRPADLQALLQQVADRLKYADMDRLIGFVIRQQFSNSVGGETACS